MARTPCMTRSFDCPAEGSGEITTGALVEAGTAMEASLTGNRRHGARRCTGILGDIRAKGARRLPAG